MSYESKHPENCKEEDDSDEHLEGGHETVCAGSQRLELLVWKMKRTIRCNYYQNMINTGGC